MSIFRCVLVFLLIPFGLRADGAPADDLQTLEFDMDGVARTALLYVPPGKPAGSLPLVFVFHGHGGTSRNAAGVFHLHRLWPDAMVIYPQGLNTVSQLTDPEGQRSGWQKAVGDYDDRDLHFFDAMLARLKKDYPVDPKRIYATGHSNGGGFTYLLWRARPEVFAAVAPCSSAARYTLELTPKPAMISGGKSDPLVKFEWQEMEVQGLRKVNGLDETGVPWEGGAGTLYPSKGGTPLVTFFYDGTHNMDRVEPDLIVKFFHQFPPPAAPAAASPTP